MLRYSTQCTQVTIPTSNSNTSELCHRVQFLLYCVRLRNMQHTSLIHTRMKHMHAPVHQRQHPTLTRWVWGLLVGWIVMLALLNPLLCLLHCEILHTHDVHHHTTSSLYVCDMMHATNSATLTKTLSVAFTQIPLPIYPALLTVLAGLPIYLAVQLSIAVRLHKLSSHLSSPVSPPPKHVSFV